MAALLLESRCIGFSRRCAEWSAASAVTNNVEKQLYSPILLRDGRLPATPETAMCCVFSTLSRSRHRADCIVRRHKRTMASVKPTSTSPVAGTAPSASVRVTPALRMSSTQGTQPRAVDLLLSSPGLRSHKVPDEAKQATEEAYAKLFEELQAQISQKEASTEGLAAMYTKMNEQENQDVFDQEDRTYVAQLFEKNLTELKAQIANYNHRRKVYETDMQSLGTQLERRKEIFDKLDAQYGVWACHPDLLKYYVEKQATLLRLYKEISLQVAPPAAATNPVLRAQR